MKKLIAVILAIIICAAPAAAADYPYTGDARGVDFEQADLSVLEEGDRIALIGDSITHGSTKTGFVNTSWFVQLYYYLATRFPALKIKTVNLGISGISTERAVKYQMETEYAKHDYNKAIMYIGTNDGAKNAYNQAGVTGNYKKIISFLEERNAEVLALITPVGVDESVATSAHRNEYLEKVSYDVIGKIADERGIVLVDQYSIFQSTYPIALSELGVKMLQDGIHPSAAGSSVTFAELIDALKLPGEVATVVLDANGVAKQSNCTVSDFKAENGGYSYTYLANALPFAQTSYVKDASQIMDYMDKFSRETLKASGLEAGTYTLKIDGMYIGNFTAEELSGGINLALYDTPMVSQSKDVASKLYTLTEATRELNTLEYTEHQVRIQGVREDRVQAMIQYYSTNSANAALYQDYLAKVEAKSIDDRWAQLETYWDEVYDLAQPTSHLVEIVSDNPPEPTPPAEEPTENNTGLYIVIAAGAIVLAGAVIAFVIFKKKK